MKFHELTKKQKVTWAKNEIKKRLETSNWETTLTIKATGENIHIQAYADDLGNPVPADYYNIGFIIVEGPKYVNGTYEDLDSLAERIINTL